MANWDDTRIFLAVARGESLSAAGRVLRMDAATVGRRVARLEQSLGTALFVKSPGGYALTEAGERLQAHADAAEQAMLAGTQAVVGQSDTLSGTIRIGAPDGCANYLLPQVCAQIGKENPDLDIQIIALPRVVNLSKREADMAITVSPPTTGRLSVQKLTDYRLHLAASRGYLDTAPALESLDDLREHRMIGYIPDMIFDKELDYLAELGVTRVSLGSTSVSVQMNCVRLGAGLGIVHDFALPFAPEVSRVLTNNFSLTRSFYLVRHADDRRMQRMNRFAAALAGGLRREVTRLEAHS